MASFFSHFKREQEKPAAQGNEVTICCTLPSADEAANAANPNNVNMHPKNIPMHPHHVVQNPFNMGPVMGGFAGAVGYLSVAGVMIGHQVYKQQQAHQIKIEAQLTKVAEHIALSKAAAQTAETKQRLLMLEAYTLYLQEQRKRAIFQKIWAGAVSPIGSGLTGIGEVFLPASPLALAILGTVGVAHVGEMAATHRQVKKKILTAKKAGTHAADNESEEEAQLRELDAAIRERHFTRENFHVVRDMWGWAGFSVGAFLIAVTQSITLLSSVVIPPAISVAGVSCLIAGVVATLVHNNILTSERFTPYLPVYLSDAIWDEKKPLTPEKIKKQNIAANEERLAVKRYRADFKAARTSEHAVIDNLRRVGQKIGGYATLGLVPTLAGDLKFANKIAMTKHAAESMGKRRVQMLGELQDIREKYLELEPVPASSLYETTSELGVLLQAILTSHHHGGVGKLLARRVMKEQKPEVDVPVTDWRGKQKSNPLTGKGLTKKVREGKAILRIAKKYGALFAHPADHKYYDNQTSFEILYSYGPCCNGDIEAHAVLSGIQKFYCDESKTLTNEQIEEKAHLTALIKEVTDHYLLFYLRKNAKERIAVFSSMSNAVDAVKAQEAEKEATAYTDACFKQWAKERSMIAHMKPHASHQAALREGALQTNVHHICTAFNREHSEYAIKMETVEKRIKKEEKQFENEVRMQNAQTDPERYGGIGAKVTHEAGVGLRIVSVFTGGTPALKRGLQEDDVITHVRQRGRDIDIRMKTAEEAVNLIRGMVGDAVTLQVVSGRTAFSITLIRDYINVASASVHDFIAAFKEEHQEYKVPEYQTYSSPSPSPSPSPRVSVCTRELPSSMYPSPVMSQIAVGGF